jgi:hypothetical protein
MWRRVGLYTDVSEERVAFIFRVEEIARERKIGDTFLRNVGS